MTEQKKAPRKRKTKLKVEKPVEVPVEESKSEEESPVVLEASEPSQLGGNDAQPEKDSGDGANNVPAKAAKKKRFKPVGGTIWTS